MEMGLHPKFSSFKTADPRPSQKGIRISYTNTLIVNVGSVMYTQKKNHMGLNKTE
jgi:hypothetical protein